METIKKADDNKNFDESKYKNCPIRLYDKQDHYELIFVKNFESPGNGGDILTDIIIDLRNANKDKELHIFVGSHGGEADALILLMQQILQFKHRVGISLGYTCSAGWLLLFCCQERYISEYAEAMYHSMASCVSAKVIEQKTNVLFHEKWWNLILNATYTKDVLTEEELKLGETTEVYFTGKELIERNAAKPYEEYLKRKILTPTNVYQIKDNLYIKNYNNTYIEYSKDNNKTFSYYDLIKKVNE